MTKILSNEADMFYEIIGLNPKIIKVSWYEKTEKKHILTIKGKLKTCECPICGKKTKKRDWLYESTMIPLWKHMLMSDGNMIELRIIRRSFRCNCGARFMERFYFEAEKWQRTKAFEDYVRFSRWHMSWAQIARNTQCDPWLTHNILSKIDEESLNKRWIEIMNELKDIYLGIDEHSFHWRDMVLVITDIKAKKVLAILDEITNETLMKRFNWLSDEIKNKIKWISTDMNKWYKNVAELNIPGIVGTVDKYHLFQEANRMVDDVRIMTIWLIKKWFMTEEDFIKRKKITPGMIKKKEKSKN